MGQGRQLGGGRRARGRSRQTDPNSTGRTGPWGAPGRVRPDGTGHLSTGTGQDRVPRLSPSSRGSGSGSGSRSGSGPSRSPLTCARRRRHLGPCLGRPSGDHGAVTWPCPRPPISAAGRSPPAGARPVARRGPACVATGRALPRPAPLRCRRGAPGPLRRRDESPGAQLRRLQPPLSPRAPPRRPPRCVCTEQPPHPLPTSGPDPARGPRPGCPGSAPGSGRGPCLGRGRARQCGPQPRAARPAPPRLPGALPLGAPGPGCAVLCWARLHAETPRRQPVPAPAVPLPGIPCPRQASRTRAGHPGAKHTAAGAGYPVAVLGIPSPGPCTHSGRPRPAAAPGGDRQVELPDRQTARDSPARPAHPPSAELPPGRPGPRAPGSGAEPGRECAVPGTPPWETARAKRAPGTAAAGGYRSAPAALRETHRPRCLPRRARVRVSATAV